MPKRTDRVQARIVLALRADGATVQTLHEVGDGCPDLLVGNRGRNYLLEVKDPDKPPSKRKLTDDQTKWHRSWLGQVDIVKTPEEALWIITHT